MFKNLSFLPLLSLFVVSPALANTETLGFTGTASSFCTITKTSDGSMAQSVDSTRLGTAVSGGSPAGFTVATNASSVLDLDDTIVVVSEPTGFTPIRSQAIEVTDDGSGSTLYSGFGNSGDSVTISSAATGTVNLTIEDSSTAQLPAGSYSYTKTITCTAP